MSKAFSAIVLSFAVGWGLPVAANLMMDKGLVRLRALSSPSDAAGTAVHVVGKIISYSTKTGVDNRSMYGAASARTSATVRLYTSDNLMEGDTLYVVDDRNLIVAKMEVKLIFNSKSFGAMLVGHGNFKNAGIENRVVRRIEDGDSSLSYIYKARGDYHGATGDEGEAISSYKQALSADRRNPEAHIALGMVYLRQGIYEFALREFREAYKRKNCIYDNEERFLLVKSMAEICFRQAYESVLPQKKRVEYIQDGVKYCRESVKIYPGSVKMHYYLGIFLSQSPAPSDVEARDSFLKVIELDPDHTGANVALARLYRKHGNLKKAKMYAQAAVKTNPNSERVRLLEKSLEPEEDDDR